MYSPDEQPLENAEEEVKASAIEPASTDASAADAAEYTQVEQDIQDINEKSDNPEPQHDLEIAAEVDDELEQEEGTKALPAEEASAALAEAEISQKATADDDTIYHLSGEDDDEEGDGRGWYVIHCYSGYENKVRHNLEQRIESMNMKDYIFDVVVPTEEEIEVKEGKRRSVERRVFPGYILVNMLMTEESWYVVRNTPGVTSFVGMGNDPIPLRKDEVSSIIKRMEADAPRIKVTFKQGERVRIIDGPFNDFRGTVDEIDMERAKVRVMVNFFGRETPVELDFLQVEKA